MKFTIEFGEAALCQFKVLCSGSAKKPWGASRRSVFHKKKQLKPSVLADAPLLYMSTLCEASGLCWLCQLVALSKKEATQIHDASRLQTTQGTSTLKHSSLMFPGGFTSPFERWPCGPKFEASPVIQTSSSILYTTSAEVEEVGSPRMA